MTVTIVLFVDPVKLGPAPVNPLPSPTNPPLAVTIPENDALPLEYIVAAEPTRRPSVSVAIPAVSYTHLTLPTILLV